MKNAVFLAKDHDPRLAECFTNMGYEIVPVHTTGIVSAPVADHPDMFMCKLGISDDSTLVRYSPESALAPEYPQDIAYNAACTGKFFIHSLRYTAPELLSAAEELGMVMVDVRQGYAKCSTVIVDEEAVITYDRGIEKACAKAGLEVLLVQPGHVLLPGYDTGFIGGASGRVGDTVYFNGDLTEHPDHAKITGFIEDRGLQAKWFEDWPLTDIGSIISCRF